MCYQNKIKIKIIKIIKVLEYDSSMVFNGKKRVTTLEKEIWNVAISADGRWMVATGQSLVFVWQREEAR